MKSIQRILIAQPFGIGDALFITPFLRALRTIPTVESVDLLLGSRTESVFRNNPHVDRIFFIDKGKWHALGWRQAFKDLVSLLKNLRARSYDLLIDFSLQREYGFYGLLSGIPRRIGLNYKNRGIFLTRSIPLKKAYEAGHAVDFYCEVGKLIGLEIEEPFLEFYVSAEDREEADKILCCSLTLPSPLRGEGGGEGKERCRFIAVAPGGGESWGKDALFKRWPAANFAEILPLLRQRIDFEGVFIVGSSAERELGEEVKKTSPFPTVNLSGEVSLGVAAALLEKSVFFLANDGGLVHLAHSLRVPLAAFYGPADPKVYGPYPKSPEAVPVMRKGLPCRPCYSDFRYNAACVDRECLTALSPEEAIQQLDRKNFWSKLPQANGASLSSKSPSPLWGEGEGGGKG